MARIKLAAYRADIRARIASAVAADHALAEVATRERNAGIDDETPEFLAVNRAVCEAFDALPWWASLYADHKAAPYWTELGWWDEPQDAV